MHFRKLVHPGMITMVLLGTTLAAQNIQVTKPHGGETFHPGEIIKIRWTHSGIPDEVRIVLRRTDNPTWKRVIAQSHPKNGQPYPFPVSEDLKTGQYYVVVRVNINQNSVIGKSASFKINQLQEVQPKLHTCLNVIYPKESDTWTKGEKVNIEWMKCPAAGGRVRIVLFPPGQKHLAETGQAYVITPDIKDNGLFFWKIPPGAPGGKQVLQVRSLDNKFHGTSGVFTIEGIVTPTPNLYVPDLVFLGMLYHDGSIAAAVRNAGNHPLKSGVRVTWRMISGFPTGYSWPGPGPHTKDFPGQVIPGGETRVLQVMNYPWPDTSTNCALSAGYYMVVKADVSPLKQTLELRTDNNHHEGRIYHSRGSDIRVDRVIQVGKAAKPVCRNATILLKSDQFGPLDQNGDGTLFVFFQYRNFGATPRSFTIKSVWDKEAGQVIKTDNLGPGHYGSFTGTIKVRNVLKQGSHTLTITADEDERNQEAYPDAFSNNFIQIHINVLVKVVGS